MRSRYTRHVALALLIIALSGGVLWAQSSGSFRMERDVIAGGGSRSSSTSFTVSGTLGQAAAGPPSLSSSSYRVRSGFWQAQTATPTPAPTATPTPTATSTDTPVPTATSTVTPAPTATSTTTPAPTATATSTPVPTGTSTSTPVPTATSTTAAPTGTPTPDPDSPTIYLPLITR